MSKSKSEWQTELNQQGFTGLEILDDEPKKIQNRFGGGSVMLNPIEIAIYDCISGAELLQDYRTVQKGIDWFIKNNTEAYAVLLD